MMKLPSATRDTSAAAVQAALTDEQCQALAHVARPLKYLPAPSRVFFGLALDGLLVVRAGRWRLTTAGEALADALKHEGVLS